jgi:hypothetical protein
MHFETITFVFEELGGKAYAPVNPAATIVACKGGPVKNPITTALTGAFERLGLATKSKPVDASAPAAEQTDAAKASAEEALENAGYSALFNLLYNLEWDVSAISNAGLDDGTKKAAIIALALGFYEAAIALADQIFGEMATKSAEKPDAAAVAKRIESLDAVIASATKAREAFAALTPPAATETPAVEPTKVEGEAAKAAEPEKTAETPVVETFDATAAVTEAIKALDIAALVQNAVKAAVEPIQAQLTDANARVEAAEKAATDAKTAQATAEKALSEAVGTARERQAPGGHQDPVETANDAENGKKAGEDTVKVPTTIREAIALLHA